MTIFRNLICVLSAALLCTSCLKETDSEVTYYDDAAITSMTLGTLKYNKRIAPDSVAHTTFNAAAYTMHIDQQTGEIYNADSLPKGVDVSKAVLTYTTKNNGVAVLKDTDSDSLGVWRATDSVDFSVPRTLRVYNNRGTEYKEYTVRLLVHCEEADSVQWHATDVPQEWKQADKVRLLATVSHVYALVCKDDTTFVWAARSGVASEFVPCYTIAGTLAYANAAVQGNILLLFDGQKLYYLQEGQKWAVEYGGRSLLGGTSKMYYGIDWENAIVSTDVDKVSKADKLDASVEYLPTEDAQIVWLPLKTNPDYNRVLLVGNRAEKYGDTTAVVWSKIEYGKIQDGDTVWTYYEPDMRNRYRLPRMAGLQVAAYDGAFVAVGAHATAFYRSNDYGLTWVKDTTLPLPQGMSEVAQGAAMTADGSNYIWMYDPAQGKLWRGRANRLGWMRK